MLLRLEGSKKDYPWGSKTLLSDYFRNPNQDQKIAEIWFGTHPIGESETSLGPLSKVLGKQLRYLVKFLSAETALSLQVHPNPDQAVEGFLRENALGIALDDPRRNYRDQSDKPEVLVALTEFRALCGFRKLAESKEIIHELSAFIPGFRPHDVNPTATLRETFTRLQADKELAASFPLDTVQEPISPRASRSLSLIQELLTLYPGDTGALISILMNYVVLDPGEAIYLPAGNLHAYISGLGVEVMAASDNVIRGGLTTKHVDTGELERLLDFTELTDPIITPKKIAEGMIEYATDASAFRIYRAEVSGSNLFADLELPETAIILCTSGEVALSTSAEEREVLRPSEVAFISAARTFSLSGSGTAFVVLGA